MKQWYAMHTKPHAESRVASHLERHEVETFLPEISGKSGPSPLFPGYLFIHVDLDKVNPTIWRWTPGVRYILAYGDTPIPIPAGVIGVVARKVDEMDAVARRPRFSFEPGDVVRIKNGPFRDLLAVLKGPIKPNRRVQVLLQAMNRSVRVRLDPTELEKASQDQKQALKEERKKKRPRRTRGRGRRIRS